MDSQTQLLIKVIILGDSSVGKTALMDRFVYGRFTPTHRRTFLPLCEPSDLSATVGPDFSSKHMKWDTAGQERYQSLGSAYYRGCDCCVLCFDVTSMASFQSLQKWKDEFDIHSVSTCKVPFVAIGNKAELTDNRAVTKKMATDWCQERGILYFEGSAKESTNVEEIFQKIAELATEYRRKENDRPEILVQIAKDLSPSGSRCCGSS